MADLVVMRAIAVDFDAPCRCHLSLLACDMTGTCLNRNRISVNRLWTSGRLLGHDSTVIDEDCVTGNRRMAPRMLKI